MDSKAPPALGSVFLLINVPFQDQHEEGRKGHHASNAATMIIGFILTLTCKPILCDLFLTLNSDAVFPCALPCALRASLNPKTSQRRTCREYRFHIFSLPLNVFSRRKGFYALCRATYPGLILPINHWYLLCAHMMTPSI